jgi:hypothetical protein
MWRAQERDRSIRNAAGPHDPSGTTVSDVHLFTFEVRFQTITDTV